MSPEVEIVAQTIRNGVAWWKLAAERLEAGDLAEASDFAKLGHLGTGDAVEQIAALAAQEVAA